MIYQLLNLIIINIGFKKIVFDKKEFFNLNLEIKENILIKAMKYLHGSNFQIRSKKINNLLKEMSEFRDISINFNKTSINKNNAEIVFSKN